MLVDDHAVVRSGLGAFLLAFDDLELVGEAGGGEEAIARCRVLLPDVILMDLVMPGMDGATATRAIRQAFPQVQVVALTSYKEEGLVQRALDAGAIGYLLKNVTAEELAEAIRAAHAGRPTLAPEAEEALIGATTETSAGLPTGTVTFLFTDIEGSSQLLEAHPKEMPAALARHHDILRESIIGHNGVIFLVVGDAFCAAFSQAEDALGAALEAQKRLESELWQGIGQLRVRMGLHTGAVDVEGGEYLPGLTPVRVQRVMSAGHGGQVLLTATTADLVGHRLPPGTTLQDLGTQRMRGLGQPERIYQLLAPGLQGEFPPLRVASSEGN
jgi:DNA-binding NarL/FixJ family response regulator